MKILFISQFLPYPPDTGGKIKTYQTIKVLSKKHQVFLVSFVDKKTDLKWEKELREICWGLKTFLASLITTSHKKLPFKAIKGIFNLKPFRVQKYFLKEVADFINNLTQNENFDAVHFDHETSVQYLPYIYQNQKMLKIYDEHNLSSEGLFGYAKYEKNLVEKLAYLIEGLKFRLYEKQIISFFDFILTISQTDRERLIELGVKKDKIKFLPVPLETEHQFHFGSKNIFFVGLLSWWPNKDAVLWFYYSVLPLVKKKIPEVKFWIVGANPSNKIKAIGERDQSTMATGYVKEILPYFRKSGVFVVPIRAGAGVRIKILKALSYGLPVVATDLATRGIGLKNRFNILLANKEEKFARMVINVLENKELAKRLSVNGIQFIKENYNQDKASAVLDRIYLEKGK